MAKFTKEMREKYTVLIPSMLDLCNCSEGSFLKEALKQK